MNSKQIENPTAPATASHPRNVNLHRLMYRPGLSPEIRDARIRFAQEWGLRSRCHPQIPMPQVERGEEWHMPEEFRDRHGRIVQLVHNYGSPPPPVMGMQMVGCLLREDMQSYAGPFSTMGELRARSEAAGRREKFGAARHLFSEPPTPRRSAPKARGRVTA